MQSTELGYLNPDRSVTGVGAFGDGGDRRRRRRRAVRHARRSRRRSSRRGACIATDTLSLGDALAPHARRAATTGPSIDNRDRIEPGGGPGSLDGDHVFDRFNPAAGVTVRRPSPRVNVYAGYSEGSRAATSIELGCADPEEPCKLPNAMAGDPPLDQVVTRTIEAGVRGTHSGCRWNAGVFRAENRDDILFVTSEQTGFGYFKNFGETRRQGLELGRAQPVGRVDDRRRLHLPAAPRSRARRRSTARATAPTTRPRTASRASRASIEIEPGDRMPFIPQHLLKVFADVQITSRLNLDVDLVATGGSYARGNENNQHEPDGTYYLGEGAPTATPSSISAPATPDVAHSADRAGEQPVRSRYATGAQLGPAGFTEAATSSRGRSRRSTASSPCRRRRSSPPARPCAPGSASGCGYLIGRRMCALIDHGRRGRLPALCCTKNA